MLGCISAGTASAQAMPITPATSQVGYTVFAFGLIPLHGDFQQFQGAVTLDPHNASACAADVTIQVASLKMASPDRQREALGPALLDASHFPVMRFAGTCEPQGIVGNLTMHGVTKPLTLKLERTADRMVGTALLRRQDYGITGLPHLVGSHVRIRLTAPLVPSFPGAAR